MRRSRLGSAGLSLLAVSTAAMISLHLKRPDLDMVATPLSFYAHGPYAGLLAVSLIASGLAVMAIVGAISNRTPANLALVALAVSGAGMALAGIVVADPWYPWERALTPRGWVHAGVVGLSVLAFPIGAVLLSGDASPVSRVAVPRRVLMGVALAFVAALVVSGALTVAYLLLGRSPGFLGLAERVLMTLAVAWLVMIAPVTGSDPSGRMTN